MSEHKLPGTKNVAKRAMRTFFTGIQVVPFAGTPRILYRVLLSTTAGAALDRQDSRDTSDELGGKKTCTFTRVYLGEPPRR